MAILSNKLMLPSCPHCGISTPNLTKVFEMLSNNYNQSNQLKWRIYKCDACGELITASAHEYEKEIIKSFPESKTVNDSISQVPKEYLSQALSSLHAPSGAVMLASSAIEAMLKDKGYKDKNLVRVQGARSYL